MARKRAIIIAATFASLFATTAVGVAIFLHFCPHYIMFRSCSPMLKAVLANDAAEIRRLAAAGEPLETRFSTWNQSSFERDATPLLLAALHGHSDAAIALIELGADVNAANEFRRSVPRFLIEHDDDVALAMILERGVDAPEFGSSREQLFTMLMYAESTGADRCAKVLAAARKSTPALIPDARQMPRLWDSEPSTPSCMHGPSHASIRPLRAPPLLTHPPLHILLNRLGP